MVPGQIWMSPVGSVWIKYYTLGVYTCVYLSLWIHRGANGLTEGAVEYCEGGMFHATCSETQVILMESALYGRMRLGKCVAVDTGNIGCKTDLLKEFDQWCSGRHECEIAVSSIVDSISVSRQPCPMDFRSYLEASYTCLDVIHKSPDLCLSSTKAEVASTSGYLASITTEETRCGSLDCPWILRVPPGQTIQINLYDFQVSSRSRSSRRDNNAELCQVYAIIKEDSIQAGETICGSDIRQRLVYTSVSNTVEIRIVSRRKAAPNDGYYMLKYDVSGCADLAPPLYGTVERHDHSATFRCNGTTDAWTMTCDGYSWIGERKNCSKPVATNNFERAILGIFTGPQWAIIVIILAIAVTVGLIIFLVGLVYLRRKRSLQGRRTSATRDRQAGLVDYYSAPAYRDSVAGPYGPKPLNAMDGSVSSENDYYRTWQLQRHQQGGRPLQPLPPVGVNTSMSPQMPHAHAHGCPGNTSPSTMIPNYTATQYDAMSTQRPSAAGEHIYESPKFSRRDLIPEDHDSDSVSESGLNCNGGGVSGNSLVGGVMRQYYELDPETDPMQHAAG